MAQIQAFSTTTRNSEAVYTTEAKRAGRSYEMSVDLEVDFRASSKPDSALHKQATFQPQNTPLLTYKLVVANTPIYALSSYRACVVLACHTSRADLT
jgi:hypothetical protein